MRILVAEDERNLNRILTEALTDEGYSVDPCFGRRRGTRLRARNTTCSCSTL